jgi:VWFA-related protein
MTHRCPVLLGAVSILLLPFGVGGQSFRSGVLMVPVDVRVLNAQGKPVLGLVKDDFVVFEDGVPQPIVDFTAATGHVEGHPSDRRVFLIDANRHWLGVTEPGFGVVDEIVSFIERQLTPDDLVGFSARGRVTDITSDHAGIVEVIRRYDAFLHTVYRRDRTGLGVRLERIRFEPPNSDLNIALDEVFAPGSARGRATKRSTQDFSALIDQIGREAVAAANGGTSRDDREAQSMARIREASARELLADIDALKDLDGEKHIISIGTTSFASTDGDQRISEIASAARISVHIVRLTDPRYTQRELDMSIQNLTARTGGLMFLERMPSEVFADIHRVTESAYHLSYLAPSATLDGRTHAIRVQLRKGLKGRVVARSSYVASFRP